MQLSPEKIVTFQRFILGWYKENKRDLPWRHTHDPYKILISEVMLQQTQVNRVIKKYQIWMEMLPSINLLAKSKMVDVLTLWSGLGYNRRALFLHRLAKEIMNNHAGKFPQDEKSLLKLPGIGKYTARAILCFAFNNQVSVVDTNIKKVILTQILKRNESDEKTIEEIATKILPIGQAYIWNQALMDYSSIMLKKEKIIIPKQSEFTNSDRYYRGAVIKMLLNVGELSLQDISQYFSHKNKAISSNRLDRILDTLLRDCLISFNRDKKVYSIS